MKLYVSWSRTLCFLFLVFSLHSPAARAWGCKGHQTVALLAERNLTPEARQFVDKLLFENPVDPDLKRFCGIPQGDLLADASTWPDDIRNDRKNGPWHYIDIPRGVPHGPTAPYCGKGSCILQAIADQLSILKDQSAAARQRAEALRYIIHFVGDLHMPLHATTNNDEGGNCVPVSFFRRQPHESGHGSFVPNLHYVWDTAILERDMEGAEPAEYADFLSKRFASDLLKWQAAGIHVDDWAWESHDLSESVVYSTLDPPVPLETPTTVHSCQDAENVGERMMRLHVRAGEAYQEVAAPVVERRIAQAGIRLALILNAAVPPASEQPQ